jgi:transcriptional regulator
LYTPAHFTEHDESVLNALIRARPFATLVANTPRGLDAHHLPLLLVESNPARIALQGHVAKANPLWRELSDNSEVLAIFHGPQHYVSPSWYPSKREHGKVVPTWNYIVVHARGTITWTSDSAWLRDFLERLTRPHEAARSDPWRIDDAPADFIDQNLQGIVGFEVEVRELIGKWKLSQNRGAEDRSGVAAGLLAEHDEQATALANAMRDREAP